MQKILITGGSGLLALNWAVAKRNEIEIILCLHQHSIEVSKVKTSMCNLDSIENIKTCLRQEKPDIVIHTAGLTSVEECEKNPELAEYVNVKIAENVAIACAELVVSLVHISTDHLFDGSESMVREEATPCPLNVYGTTKAKAETKVMYHNVNALIIRTNFYGWGTSYRYSFSDFIIQSLRLHKKIKLFEDVFYTPILAYQLVQVTHQLLGQRLSGIFNVVGDERVSKYDFGVQIIERFGLQDDTVEKIKVRDKRVSLKRPMDMSLSNEKVSKYLSRPIGNLGSHLQQLKQQEQQNIAQELSLL